MGSSPITKGWRVFLLDERMGERGKGGREEKRAKEGREKANRRNGGGGRQTSPGEEPLIRF